MFTNLYSLSQPSALEPQSSRPLAAELYATSGAGEEEVRD